MDSFVLLADASLAASRTLLQQLLTCLYFTLDSEDLFYILVYTNKISDFYELWLQHRQLKTMEMSDTSADTYSVGYIYTSIPT